MNRKHYLAVWLSAAAMTLSAGAGAAPSWDYVELDYTDAELEDTGIKADVNGLSIDAAASINDVLFFRGQGTSWASDGEDLGVNDTDLTIIDWMSVGPGAHYTTSAGDMDLDLWGQVTLDRAAFIAVAPQGFGISLGARLGLTPEFETGLSYRMASTDNEFGGMDTTFDPAVFTLEGLYHVTPSSAIRIAYMDGDADVEGSALGIGDETIDLSGWQIGYRHLFDGDNGGAGDTPDPLSFNLVQIDLFVAGDSEISVPGNSYDFDLDRGYAVRGSFETGSLVFIGGEVLNFDYEDSDAGLGTEGDIVTVNDLSFFGPGVHMPLGDNVEVYGQLGLSRAHYIYVPTDGFGGKVGARARFDMVELGAWYSMSDTDGDLSGETITLEPGLYGVDLALEFSPGAPELALGYFAGTIDLETDTVNDAELKPSGFSLGVRQRF